MNLDLKPWHPFVADVRGNLEPALIAQRSTLNTAQSWHYSLNATFEFDFFPQDIKFDKPEQLCTIAHPHSNAFLDIDGDCLADLFLTCESNGKQSFQIWLNRKDQGFVFHSTTELPIGTGPITFADMDADGTIDMVFSTCENQKCFIHVAYNSQIGLCEKNTQNCRDPKQLCTSDPNFSFQFDTKVYVID
jgi:integrin alpha FG-GAP repeat containing protein 1